MVGDESYPNLATIEQIVTFVLVHGQDALYTEEGRPFVEAWREMAELGRPLHEYTGVVLANLGTEEQEQILDTVTPALTKCIAKIVQDQLEAGNIEGAQAIVRDVPWQVVRIIRCGFWLGFAVGLRQNQGRMTRAIAGAGISVLPILMELEVLGVG